MTFEKDVDMNTLSERVEKLKDKWDYDNGFMPTHVFFGKKEMQYLKHQWFLGVAPYSVTKISDMDIIKVDKESYVAVGNLREEK